MILYGILYVGEELPDAPIEFEANIVRDVMLLEEVERDRRLVAWQAAYPDLTFCPFEITL